MEVEKGTCTINIQYVQIEHQGNGTKRQKKQMRNFSGLVSYMVKKLQDTESDRQGEEVLLAQKISK